MPEDAPEVKAQLEKEQHQAELSKVAAKEKQEFMENLIQTVSPNMLFKSQEDTILQEQKEDGGMKELKVKYDTLKAQGPSLGF